MYQIFGVNIAVLSILLVWTIVWKALGLWKAARKGDLAWFIIMLIINTAGILPIIYIYLVNRDRKVVKKAVIKKPARKKTKSKKK